MAFLVDHLPPQVRLVISTRADPALPLARLRARGELVEVRAADLRFTARGGGRLPRRRHRAAARAPATSPPWRTAPRAGSPPCSSRRCRCGAGTTRPAFIAGFAGDDRFVVDYLVEEVLDRQPEDVRDFLLGTSILDRLTGPLCDAVTGRTGGQADARGAGPRQPVPGAARRPAALVPLPPPVRRRAPGAPARRAPRAGRRAAPAGQRLVRARPASPSAAVRHALAAGDVDRAADLVELAVPALRADAPRGRDRGAGSTRSPTTCVRNRPVLAIGFVGALMASNEFAGVERAAGRRRAAARAARRRAGRRRPRRARPASRRPSRCTGPRSRSSPATWPATMEHAERAVDRARRRTTT